jgi:hypothetical protein
MTSAFAFGDSVIWFTLEQPSFICHFAMTLLAALRTHLDHMIRLGYKLAFMFLVPFRRAVSVPMATLRLVLFLIPRWRLRGVLRVGWWLSVMLNLHLQGFIICLQLGKIHLHLGKLFQLLKLRQDQFNQLFFGQPIKFVTLHLLTILPNFTPFLQPGE